MDKKVWVFILLALLLNLGFFFLIDFVPTPFPKLVGRSLELIANIQFDYTNNLISTTKDQEIEVNNLCTGFASFFLLASIVILQKLFRLTTNRWRNIIIFLPLSWALLYIINLIRLLIIFYLGDSPTSTEHLHILGWILMSFTVFLLWTYFEKKE